MNTSHSARLFLGLLGILAPLLLVAACFAQESPPSPARVGLSTPSDAAQRDIAYSLGMSLLLHAGKEHPDMIAPAVSEAHKMIEEKYAGDAKGLAEARTALCALLFQAAPGAGLEEFESIEADPGAMTAQYHAFLRLMAAQAYMAEGRTDTAYRLFKGLVEDEQNAESTRAFCWICMSQLKRSRQDQQECLAKARTLAEESHSPHLLMVLMLQLQSGGSPEEILPAFRQVAEQADDPRLLGMFGTMLGCSSIDSKEAEKLLKDSYAKILASSAKDPAQHVTDLMWFAAAATEHHPDMALAASKEAEVFAGKMVPGSEQLRLARLCRAKVLQKTGHASEAGPYSDVDTAEEMDVSFNFRQSIKDGVPTLEVQVSVVSAKEGK